LDLGPDNPSFVGIKDAIERGMSITSNDKEIVFKILSNENYGPNFYSSRKTLDNPHFDLSLIPEENFVVEFLAHLRLHNRSEKRHLNNKEICKDISWKIFDAEENIVRINNQTDWYKKGCRNEIVYFDDSKEWYSYRDVWDEYGEQLNDQQILGEGDNAQINLNFCNILTETRINIKKATEKLPGLLPFWYLSFGCEVIRNPAAIIHFNMVLDLIQSGSVSNGVEVIDMIPMSASDSINPAMKLNKLYAEYMPHDYSYNLGHYVYNKPEIESLIKREAQITKEWLKLKLGEVDFGDLVERYDADPSEVVAEVWDCVSKSFKDWELGCLGENLGAFEYIEF